MSSLPLNFNSIMSFASNNFLCANLASPVDSRIACFVRSNALLSRCFDFSGDGSVCTSCLQNPDPKPSPYRTKRPPLSFNNDSGQTTFGRHQAARSRAVWEADISDEKPLFAERYFTADIGHAAWALGFFQPEFIATSMRAKSSARISRSN